MTAFEEILKARGLRLGQFLDARGREDITSFWDTLLSDRSFLTDAETDAVIQTYVDLGVVEKDDGVDRSAVEARSILDPKQAKAIAGWLNLEGTADTSAASKDPNARISDHDKILHTNGERRPPASAQTKDAGQNPQADPAADNKTDPVPNNPGDLLSVPKMRSHTEAAWDVVISDAHEATAEHPILVLADPDHVIPHHQVGGFTNPENKTAFEYVTDKKLHAPEILQIDSRFIKIVTWLGEGHIAVKLSGYPVAAGYAVYKIRAVDVNANETLQTANNDFLQLIIRRMQAAEPRPDLLNDEEADHSDATMKLTDMPSLTDFMRCAGDSLPDNIRNWAHRNIALVNANSVSQEEQRHAQRALSMMLNIEWQGSEFEPIDPVEARRILDEELYGMENVKQRIIETIIQINRTHTLPTYGLLLVGPAGTGKSQIAYAVAKILKLPWASLDMSAIHTAEALTGSPRVYSNAKPGKIMEAFSQAGTSNIVFIINELDKANSGNSNEVPADALLTLLDNLGYTDNYIECTIPTSGVYPIATANDRSLISEPLLTRFAEIDIPPYTQEEKKIIFTDYSLPRILKKLCMNNGELTLTDDAVNAVVDRFADTPGVRGLEQAAEHIAANALYRIETKGLRTVTFDKAEVEELLKV